MAALVFDHSVVVVALILSFKWFVLKYLPILASIIALTIGQGLAKAL